MCKSGENSPNLVILVATNIRKNNNLGGCGGGQMVSVLVFYSNDPSSDPAEFTVFIL